jgi:hypothetical protein
MLGAPSTACRPWLGNFPQAKGDSKMKPNKSLIWFVSLVGLIGFVSSTNGANAQAPAQERPFFSPDPREAAAPLEQQTLGCTGPTGRVIDVGYDGMKRTTAVYGSGPGGGEGKQFDRTPLLSTKVTLNRGACLNAHLSAIMGSRLYGVSSMALFQVSLTRMPGGTPIHMVGHYHTPFGVSPQSPAIGMEAERDVDMLGANFFQKIGSGPHELPPGNYNVDVWWAGAPPGATPGGAIGFSFVLKLYLK